MASRLHKWGSVFSRLDGLLKNGGIKEVDKPLWYDIYAQFPPVDEPNYGRPAKEVEVRNIFYPEDVVRAEVHKVHSETFDFVDLTNESEKTRSQKCIELFNTYTSEGLSKEDSLEKIRKEAAKITTRPTVKFTEIFSKQSKEIDN